MNFNAHTVAAIETAEIAADRYFRDGAGERSEGNYRKDGRRYFGRTPRTWKRNRRTHYRAA